MRAPRVAMVYVQRVAALQRATSAFCVVAAVCAPRLRSEACSLAAALQRCSASPGDVAFSVRRGAADRTWRAR
jgi:hypothetical protein